MKKAGTNMSTYYEFLIVIKSYEKRDDFSGEIPVIESYIRKIQ